MQKIFHQDGTSFPLFPGEIGIWKVVFFLGVRTSTNNKHQMQESNLGHSGGRWALAPLSHPCPLSKNSGMTKLLQNSALEQPFSKVLHIRTNYTSRYDYQKLDITCHINITFKFTWKSSLWFNFVFKTEAFGFESKALRSF